VPQQLQLLSAAIAAAGSLNSRASTFILSIYRASFSGKAQQGVPAKGNDQRKYQNLRHTGRSKNVNKSARGFTGASNSASVPEPIR